MCRRVSSGVVLALNRDGDQTSSSLSQGGGLRQNGAFGPVCNVWTDRRRLLDRQTSGTLRV
jgi:hypothetical protein